MPTIWRFTDGKPGHERQTAGFVKAFCSLLPCEVFEIAVKRSSAVRALFGRGIPNAPSGKPDLLLGAGNACQVPLLSAHKAYGGSSIYFMRPSLPLSWFDLCVIPKHDSPPLRDNILLSEGVLNDFDAPTTKQPDTGLILLGGPSKHHAWDNAHVMGQVEEILAAGQSRSPRLSFRISASRRTPAETRVALEKFRHAGYQPLEEQDGNWLRTNLASAAEVWVSADSVSMMYEALSSGARLGIVDVPVRRTDRITNIAPDLVTRDFATGFKRWQQTHELGASPTLREAERIAALVASRLNIEA